MIRCMREQAEKELHSLLHRGWDPRRGRGRWVGWSRWFGYTAIAVMLGAGFMMGPVMGPFALWYDLLFWGIVAGLIGCWLMTRGITARTRARARACDYFLCPWCRYDLTAGEDEGVCPECGARYEREACRELYISAYRDCQPEKHLLLERERVAWRRALELKHEQELRTK